jgi:hypothetical protein
LFLRMRRLEQTRIYQRKFGEEINHEMSIKSHMELKEVFEHKIIRLISSIALAVIAQLH